MTKREWEKLNSIVGRLEALQNETKDRKAKERMQEAKTALLYLLRDEP